MIARRAIGAAAVLLAIGTGARAQSEPAPAEFPVTEGKDLRFAHLALGVGPSHRRITAIAQDDLGFLWIGTDDGLRRYDGYRVREYRHDPKDPNSLPDSFIITVFKDQSGKLWIASGRYLDVYDPALEKFTPVLSSDGSGRRFQNRVGRVDQDRAGTIWLSTDTGLYEVSPTGGIRYCFRHKAGDVASLSSDVVRSVLETKDGTLWVATGEGLDAIDRASRRVTRRVAFSMPHSVYTAMLEDHAGILWLAYSGAHGYGLATVDRKTNSLNQYRVNPVGVKVSPGVRTFLEDEDGQLWIAASHGGLYKLDRNRTGMVRYRNDADDPSTLASNQLTVLFEDREGGVWVGTHSNGLDRFNRKPLPFRRLVHEAGNPNSLENEAVNTVYRDSRGILWIGCTQTLIKVDPTSGKYEFYRSHGMPRPGGMSSMQVNSILEDPSGDLWFGMLGSGLNRFDPRTGHAEFHKHDKTNPASLSNNTVMSLHFDRSGVLWAGTEDGLNAFNAKTNSFRVYAPPVRPSAYRRIAEDKRGGLWLSSGWSGVHHFDPVSGKFRVYRHSDDPETLSSDAVNAVCVDRDGIVWVGTQVGLNRLDPATGKVRVYNPGKTTISVDSILEDGQGQLWLGTENGLSRFDPKTATFRHFFTSDGLAANELGFSAAWKSPSGEMYFGSYGGLTVFDPARIVDDSQAPPVRLTDIQVAGKPVGIGDKSPLRQSISVTPELRLAHEQNMLSLEFAALTFGDPARSRYRYRLEPAEKEWNEVDSSRRTVSYVALPTGDYVFRVLGCNSRGIWNEAGVRLAISVLPPWWSTWWFRALCAAVVLALLWMAYRYRMWQVEREARQLRDVIETIPAYVWSALPDGRVDFVNRRWLDFSGFSLERAVGWGWAEAVHVEDRDRLLEAWRGAMKSGNALDAEARMCGADGRYRWLLFRVVPLRDSSGRIIKWYGKSTDIEDLKLAEQERERMRELESELAHLHRVTMMGELAASIAHEVNQPLTGIVTNGSACVRLLAGDAPDLEEARDAARAIVRDGKRAGEVIARIRAMTKRAATPREPLDVNEIIGEVIVLMGQQARKNAVSILTDYADDLPLLSGDRVQVQQVVLNLAINGIQAMSSVEGRARQLKFITRRVDCGRARITVQDTGTGLDPAGLDKIFQPFYTTKASGMGMGLSICRSIVQSHGGELWATNNGGPGTSFHFTLPQNSSKESKVEAA